MLDHVIAVHRSVATVEENIEYRLPRVHQTATRPDLGLGVTAALRAVLKQDPDTVMVADLEDDSLVLALQAAKRGVFILGGIRARTMADAMEAVPDAEMIVAQRVLRRLAPSAIRRPLTRAEAEVLEGKVNFAKVLAALKEEGVVHEHTAWKDVAVFTGEGNGSYKGMVGIQEVSAGGQTGLTLLEDALFKAVQGLVSIEEVVEMAGE
jgi:general secretion pathway protein E